MNMTMSFTELGSVISSILDLSTTPHRQAIELVSPPGLGKSEFVAELRRTQSERTGQPWGFQTLMLATQSPTSLFGFGIPTTDDAGRARTTYTMPIWMQTSDGRTVFDYPRGILFLDEFGQAEPDVKRAAAELLLNGRIGSWALPQGWSVIAASNRASDRSGVSKSFDFVINRRAEVHIRPDLPSWEAWATRDGVHPVTIAWANANPHIVFSGSVPDVQGPWATPRSIVSAGRALQALAVTRWGNDERLPDDGVATALVAGWVGEGNAAGLMAHIRLANEMPAFADIVADPRGCSVPTKPDAAMLVAYSLAHRVDMSTADPCITYVQRLRPEFAATFAKSAVSRSPLIATTPAFSRWVKDNVALKAAYAA